MTACKDVAGMLSNKQSSALGTLVLCLSRWRDLGLNSNSYLDFEVGI